MYKKQQKLKLKILYIGMKDTVEVSNKYLKI